MNHYQQQKPYLNKAPNNTAMYRTNNPTMYKPNNPITYRTNNPTMYKNAPTRFQPTPMSISTRNYTIRPIFKQDTHKKPEQLHNIQTDQNISNPVTDNFLDQATSSHNSN